MSSFLPQIRPHLRSGMTPSCTHSSRTVEEQLMVLILKLLCQMKQWLAIVIEKVTYHRMFSRHVHLICVSAMFFPDGKEVLQMDEYMMMHADTAWQFLREHTFWWMLGFQHVLVSSYQPDSSRRRLTARNSDLSCKIVN